MKTHDIYTLDDLIETLESFRNSLGSGKIPVRLGTSYTDELGDDQEYQAFISVVEIDTDKNEKIITIY